MRRRLPFAMVSFGRSWLTSSAVVRWDRTSIKVASLLGSVTINANSIERIEVIPFGLLLPMPALRISWRSQPEECLESLTITAFCRTGKLMADIDQSPRRASVSGRRIAAAHLFWGIGMVAVAHFAFARQSSIAWGMFVVVVVVNRLLLSVLIPVSSGRRIEP